MPPTTLPPEKEKAAEISRKITNSRPLRREAESPEGQVTGGFNQKTAQDLTDRSARERKK